jgi:hypothetical protein
MSNLMTQGKSNEPRELNMADLDAVNGGMLPAVIQNIINKIACEVHGGDYFSNGTSSVCSGA